MAGDGLVLPGLFRRDGGGWVSEKMFSREQYEQLRSFPEISRDELFRYFTLTPADGSDPLSGGSSCLIAGQRHIRWIFRQGYGDPWEKRAGSNPRRSSDLSYAIPARPEAASTAAQLRPGTRCGTGRVCQDGPHASRSRDFCWVRGSGRGQRL